MGGNTFDAAAYAKPELPTGVQEPITGQTMGWATKQMHNGSRVRRAGWNGKGMWLKLIRPGDYTVSGSVINDTHVSEMLPFVGMRTADRKFVPWLCAQTDLLACDWEIAPDPEPSLNS